VSSVPTVDLHLRRFDAPFGAELLGLDLHRPLDAATKAAFLDAVDAQVAVLVRTDPPLTHAELDAFAAGFGPLRPSLAVHSHVVDHPGINYVSNVVEAGGVAGTGGSDEIDWHSDLGLELPLTRWIVLDCLETAPGSGGNTSFANCYLAWEALDAATRARVRDLRVRYSVPAGELRVPEDKRGAGIALPLVQRHPRSGRESVWPNLGYFDAEVEGMPRDRGDALLRELRQHCTRPEHVYEHTWQAGDLVLWDNVGAMHRRESFDGATRPILRHVSITDAPTAIT
jgi:taurine dioxygenase